MDTQPFDSHTHTHRPGALVNLDPVDLRGTGFKPASGMVYSVGIHPWHALCHDGRDIARLKRLAAHPKVLAIGETGLDTVHMGYEWVRHGHSRDMVQALPSLEAQMELLKLHIALSQELDKPLLLHVVKRFPEIQALRVKLKPAQPWIIHGFRGKPGLAADLVRQGFYLSYGERFNPLSVAVTPPGQLLVETDESTLPVGRIASALLPHIQGCESVRGDEAVSPFVFPGRS